MITKIKRTFGYILSHPLSKKHPLKSIEKFLVWQLQSGFSPSKFFVKDYVGGVKFYARKGLTGITGNIYSGLHEFNDMGFLLHLLREEDVFFDIGANAGSYTLLASGVRKADSISLEPVASTFNILTRNVGLNKLNDKVTLINAGAGSKAATLKFSANEDTTNHVIGADEINQGDTIEVPVITADSLLEKKKPTLIKIDVEGFETEVLNGMVKTLASAGLKAIIIELNGSGLRYGFDEDKIHRKLVSNDFKCYQYDPFERQLSRTEKYGSFNTIYCRDLDFVNDRIKNAERIEILGERI